MATAAGIMNASAHVPERFASLGSGLVGADQLLAVDPPAPTGTNGWTPATVRAVPASGQRGSLRASLEFLDEPTRERPGQRLSQAMVDELTPFYARQFHVDERVVRRALSEVYLYVGGIAEGRTSATTNGTHMFVPNDEDLEHILSDEDGGRRWLTHELAHVLQWVVYDGRNVWHSVSEYQQGYFLGVNPGTPGLGLGDRVWGSLLTGSRIDRDHLHGADGYAPDRRQGTVVGEQSRSTADIAQFSIVPAAIAGVGLGVVAGGAIDATRHLAKLKSASAHRLGALHIPSHWNGWLSGAAAVTAPMLVGGIAGAFGDRLGRGGSEIAGAAGGAAVAGAGLLALRHTLRNGSVAAGGLRGWAPIAAGAALGALEGALFARTSANTIRGWSDTAKLESMTERVQRPPDDYADATHDAHWMELDAEGSAREYLAWLRAGSPPIDASASRGRVPEPPGELGERLAWGVTNPLLVGAPAALAAGGAVLAARTGFGAVRDTVTGEPVVRTIGRSISRLAGNRQGLVNSMGVGAALTLVPLVAGGVLGGLADAAGWDRDPARYAAAGAAAAVSGAQLAWLLGRSGSASNPKLLVPKLLGGMAIAGAAGLVSASVATRAADTLEREYRVG